MTGIEIDGATVRQLGNDVAELRSSVSIIGGRQMRQDNRFTEIFEDLEALSQRIDSLESKVNQVLDLLRR